MRGPRVYRYNGPSAPNLESAGLGYYVAEHCRNEGSGNTPEQALEALARYFELLAKDCRDEKLRRLRG